MGSPTLVELNEQEIYDAQQLDFEKWRIIDISKLSNDKDKLIAYRLNALGSFYYFSKVILRHHRFADHFHRPLAEEIENYHVQKVIEVPRDHFKTTLFSESAPMWWALPFGDGDEQYMRSLGYSDNFIKWMRRAHDRDTNTLIISEVVDNCIKFGIRVDSHYQNNNLFRGCFPEILPDESCKWTEKSKTHKRSKSSQNGEGTYDYLGVGGALQSRHYKRIIEDDLVGKKALKSDTVMQDTIQYHQLLVGGFDSSEDDKITGNDEIIVGNRWSEKDLNQWMRENEANFKVINHSALGGCCAAHPLGKVVFPEEFTLFKLERWKQRLGAYLFSCQFLNDPVAPGATRWNENQLCFYKFGLGEDKVDRHGNSYKPVKIEHEVKNGLIIKDLWPRDLIISLLVDPNHSGADGKCRHAVVVLGLHKPSSRLYLLDCFAEACGYRELCQKIKDFVWKWNLRKIWVETVAAQKYLKFHLDEMNLLLPYEKRFKVEPLKTDRSENGKAARIESMDMFYENDLFYCSRTQLNFTEEFRKYPNGKTVDILDIIGYAPQTWENVANAEDVKSFIAKANANNPYTISHVPGLSGGLSIGSSNGRSNLTGY